MNRSSPDAVRRSCPQRARSARRDPPRSRRAEEPGTPTPDVRSGASRAASRKGAVVPPALQRSSWPRAPAGPRCAACSPSAAAHRCQRLPGRLVTGRGRSPSQRCTEPRQCASHIGPPRLVTRSTGTEVTARDIPLYPEISDLLARYRAAHTPSHGGVWLCEGGST